MGWPVDTVVLILGDDAEELLGDVSEPVEVLIDPEWQEGPAAGLRCGFDLVVREERSEAIVVTWLDRALPGADAVDALLAASVTSHRPIVATKYRYATDHPLLVREALWDRVLGMEGGATLDALVATHPEWVTEVWVDTVPPRRFESADDVARRR
jgi:CTP:molybdopterin cytidylyltransferase MocA